MADEKKVPYLTVNYDAKTFTINEAVKPTAQDEDMITRYLRAGFKMRYKSTKRTANATEKALTNAQILKAFEEEAKDEKRKAIVAKAQEVYNAIKSDTTKGADGKRLGGFFKAKTWYEKKYKTGEWEKEEAEK